MQFLPIQPAEYGNLRQRLMRYSLLSLARNAFSGHRDWTPTWRDAEPKPEYDVVIIGGGGHGLATAYYLAKEHGLANVAVLEKGQATNKLRFTGPAREVAQLLMGALEGAMMLARSYNDVGRFESAADAAAAIGQALAQLRAPMQSPCRSRCKKPATTRR